MIDRSMICDEKISGCLCLFHKRGGFSSVHAPSSSSPRRVGILSLKRCPSMDLHCNNVVYFGVSTHMKKAVMLFKGSKGAQFLFTAKYQNN